MTRFTFISSAVLATLFVVACGAPGAARDRAEVPPFDLIAMRANITQLNERFTQAHVTGDIATIDSMFAPDATSYPPGASAVTGLEAMHAFTAKYLEAGISEFTEETTDFYGDSGYLVDAGTYMVVYGPDHLTERGKYLNVWTQVNGQWKLKSSMWNIDGAPPSPE